MTTTETMTRDMRPYRKGDGATLPDEMAAKLVKDGDARDPRPYPPFDVAPAATAPEKEPEKPSLSRPRDYFTRDKRAGRPGGRR